MLFDLSAAGTSAFAKQLSTASLGDHSYIVVVGDAAIAIDIQRDLDRFDSVLNGLAATLTAVLETHVHNDYVSGGKRLAEAHGAAYVLPANTGAPYPHTALRDGETIPVGEWSLRAMHTPGHTHNHMSYVLESHDGPVAIFSGGSMLVGAVGRSDLLGPDHTEQLLNDQYTSAHRIADELPDPTMVAPTHGSGSFCSASDVADTTSTIALERFRNPALLAPSVEAFSMSQVMGYKQYPAYYQHMAPANLMPMGAPPKGPLPTVTALSSVGHATVVDIRPFPEYAAGHLSGSVSIEKSNDDAVYLGWTLEWGSPVALVGSEQDAEEVRVHLQRIGWDDVVGRIDPADLAGLADGALSTTGVISFAQLPAASGATLLDVRDPVEHRDGIVPGAVPIHLADFVSDPRKYADGDVIVHCLGGYRAGIAVGFAEAAGLNATCVHDGLENYKGPLVAPSGATT